MADVALGAVLLYGGAFMPADVTNLASYPHIVAYVDNLMTRAATSNMEMLKQGWREKMKGETAAAAAAAGVDGGVGGADVVAGGGAVGNDQAATASGGVSGAVKGGVAASPGSDDVGAAGADANKKQRTV